MTSNIYDVVIVGGGIIGSAIAYFLAAQDEFDGTILVVEKDFTYEKSSTSLSVGGIRQQFSTPENIEISKFGAQFIKSIHNYLTTDGLIPDVAFSEFGYLFLATEKGLPILKQNHSIQKAYNDDAVLLSPKELTQRFKWLNPDEIVAGSLGVINEGWLDPYSLLMGFLKKSKSLNVTYLEDEVIDIKITKSKVIGVTTAKGETIDCGLVVNAAGTQARHLAAMAGINDLPVFSRKRYVYVINCRERLVNCPLVIDPTGVYFRPEGDRYICGVSPPEDQAPECFDFKMEYELFEKIVWPVLAHRVPAFEAIKLGTSWAGHYAYNIKDQNAILGPHPERNNFIFANGFSGHGLQQAPAVGRAISELITFGSYQTLDLHRFSFERFSNGELVKEENVV